ncbi:hypothetical protein [Bifidobacterium sp. AGR2158]|uniref:hypothetical protein n=1 Tax=Bifidobacterium sp. AGR2158 TaxID=1280675 RepID=UPI0003F9A76F|nr:hypothetical protein [Bifidobacterium sp. AGR2158]
MSVLQGFEPVNPASAAGKAVLTVTPRYMRFNKNTVQELEAPNYVQILTNPHTKQIAIRECSEADPNAIEFVKPSRKTASVTLNSPVVLNAVLRFFNFPPVADDEVAFAQLKGMPFPDDKTVIFDVRDCRQGVMKKRGRKKGVDYSASDQGSTPRHAA